MGLESILVPTDFSEGAQRALERALKLPLEKSAKLTLLHVLPDDIPGTLREDAIAEGERSLENAMAKVRALASERGLPQLQIVGDVVEGAAPAQILKRAHTVEADVIVLGRHGRHRVLDLFIGTTAQRVAREGDVPVLLVQLPPAEPYRATVVAIDLTLHSARVANTAADVTGAKHPLTLFHASGVHYENFVTLPTPERETYRKRFEEDAGKALKALVKELDDEATWEPEVQSGDARALLLDKVRAVHADLLAVGAHGRTGVRRLIAGSVAEWVLTHAPCDVLIVK